MKNCTKCKYAKWDRTKTGRLHPSGDGRCEYPYKMLELPASFYWVGPMSSRGYIYKPSGGSINRQEELAHHCIYYTEE